MTTMLMRKETKTKAFTGGAQAACCLVMVLVLAVTSTAVRSEEAKKDAKTENKLVGTWQLVSAKYGGQEANLGEGITSIKHITPSQFTWLRYDKEGKVTSAAGGDYTLKGEVYEESPKYGMSDDFDVIKGKPQTFKWKVEGNKWYHKGELSNGLTIDEVWERVEKK